MQRIIFVDLDDTLFQTRKKNRLADRLAAVDKQGNPLSFQSDKQAAFSRWLAADDALVVPVTGRNVHAFQRVKLLFPGPAICSFGGVILDSARKRDQNWQEQMETQARLIQNLLHTLMQEVQSLAARLLLDVRCSLVEEMGMPLYLSVKNNRCAEGRVGGTILLAQALGAMVPDHWSLHLNGSNMALLPPFLRKEKAVAHMMQKLSGLGEILYIGVGDSLTDQGFMALCDFAITPGQSQMMQALGRCSKEIKYFIGL